LFGRFKMSVCLTHNVGTPECSADILRQDQRLVKELFSSWFFFSLLQVL
jgi:hypothetical protein